MKSLKRWLIAGLALAVVIGATAFFLLGRGGQEALANSDGAAADSTSVVAGAEESEEKDEAIPVELSVAREQDMPNYYHATGTIEARRNVELIAEAAGRIDRLAVEEGDYVKAGQILLEIEHEEQKLLADKAAVMAKTAAAERERVEGIGERGLATAKEIDDARQAAEVARYDHELAVEKLEDHFVRAPYSGVVTTRHIELGQTINPGDQLFGLAQMDPMELRLFLPESIVRRLAIGQPVEITPDVERDERLTGQVERIAPAVDPATSTVKVTIGVENAGGSVRTGSFVRARVTTDVSHDAVVIPKRALVAEAGTNYVFIAEADTVRKVEVETGFADEELTEILAGVGEGESVVMVGQGGLRQGSRIRVLDDVQSANNEEKDEEQLASLGG